MTAAGRAQPAGRGLPPGRALVTGGARRLGRAMALALAEDGWSVAIHFHGSADAAAETVAGAMARGAAGAAALDADLTREDDAAALIERAAAALGGPLTLLINNASIFERDEVDTVTRQSWSRHFDANLRAPFLLSQAFAAQAPEPTRLGAEPCAAAMIVNMLDQRVLNPTPHFVSYTLTKSALWTMTQTLALALGPAVRVNGIGPGPTLAATLQSAEHFARQREMTPLARGADPVDVAAALRYLIAAPAVTGQMIALDGGAHLHWRP